MLKPLAQDLWHAPYSFSVNGLRFLTRMTVVRLSQNRLWLHSPIPLNSALRAEITALGNVSYVIAPSKTHHLFAAPCAAEFPNAEIYGAPGLLAKRPDIPRLIELNPAHVSAWQPELEYEAVAGIPFGNEIVWFHRPSATLIVCDLVQWWQAELPWPSRTYAALTGVRRRLAVPRTVRALVRDRAALRRSVQRILDWPFERVITAHDSIVEINAHDEMARALSVF